MQKQRIIDAKSAEILKLAHVQKMQQINYDRNEIALKAPHIYKRSNYSKRLFYIKPEIMKDSHYQSSNKKRFAQILTFFTFMTAGYFVGLKHSDPEDKRQYIYGLETPTNKDNIPLFVEEQLYYHLMGSKDPK